MADRLLSTLFKVSPNWGQPLNMLEQAISRFGEIRTFFSKYNNPIGIELEIEGVGSDLRGRVKDLSLYWRFHEDGSLKMSGAEFVSVPLGGKNIDYAIHEISKLMYGYNYVYTHRCSTHVHLNVSYLTEEQFKLLLLVSALFEPLLHQLCHPIRKHNPFCYPITLLDIQDVLSCSKELKYCGINPAPARTQLSLEYRQLHGTDDWKLLRRWVQLICKMYYYVRNTSPKVVREDLIKSAETGAGPLVKKVFGASSILFYDSDLACKESSEWVLVALSQINSIPLPTQGDF